MKYIICASMVEQLSSVTTMPDVIEHAGDRSPLEATFHNLKYIIIININIRIVLYMRAQYL